MLIDPHQKKYIINIEHFYHSKSEGTVNIFNTQLSFMPGCSAFSPAQHTENKSWPKKWPKYVTVT